MSAKEDKSEHSGKADVVADATHELAALEISAGDAPAAADGGEGKTGKKDQNVVDAVEYEEDDDANLFKPPPPKQECPLCFLPLPSVSGGYFPCCGKKICGGCMLKHEAVWTWTNKKRVLKDPPETPIEAACAFCREQFFSIPDLSNLQRKQSYENKIAHLLKKRMARNDPAAIFQMANYYAKGTDAFPKNYGKAEELYLLAAELGSAEACWKLTTLYHGKDDTKYIHYLKFASKRGHAESRLNLGVTEANQGNAELAVKHWMISAKLGDDASLKLIRESYRNKIVTKDQFEEAIRAYQKAKEDMSSFERDMARKFREGGRYNWAAALSESELAKLCGVRESERAMFSIFYGLQQQQ